MSQPNLFTQKTELELEMKSISTFTELRGHGDEHWPTGSGVECIFPASLNWPSPIWADMTRHMSHMNAVIFLLCSKKSSNSFFLHSIRLNASVFKSTTMPRSLAPITLCGTWLYNNTFCTSSFAQDSLLFVIYSLWIWYSWEAYQQVWM